MKKIRIALGLLNSMVLCGEQHSEQSEKALFDALIELVELKDMLREMEFIDRYHENYCCDVACPYCGGYPTKENIGEEAGHKPDCKLAKILKGE